MKSTKKVKYKINKKVRKVQESPESYSTSNDSSLTPESLLSMFKETKEMFKEGEKQFKETREQFKETREMIKETTKLVNKVTGYVSNQWGKLMEAIFSPNCKEVFRERGYEMDTTISNFSVDNKNENLEIDLLLTNPKVVILLEVKSEATLNDIEDIKKDIAKFRRMVPLYKEARVMGAIAALRYKSKSDTYAEKVGFFVLSPKGENLVKINNTKEFIPAVF